MEYKRFENTIIARIDKNEEILEQVKTIALKENIKLASIHALGAINDFTVGVFKVDEKKYYANSFQGNYEIVSLTGTINTMNDEYYCHLHLSAGNESGQVPLCAMPHQGIAEDAFEVYRLLFRALVPYR